jgi:hypothetical protein
LADIIIPMQEWERAVMGAFEAMGPTLVNILKDAMNDTEAQDSGRLIDGVTWATQKHVDRALIGSRAKDEDVIQKTDNPFEMHVGTANPYAPYVEHGSLPHTNSSGEAATRAFEDNMLAWAKRHGFTKRGRLVETVDDIYPLLQHIRKTGTDANPFMGAAKTEADKQAQRLFNTAMLPFMRAMMRNRKATRTVIPIQITI